MVSTDELNNLIDGITLSFQDRGGSIQVHFEPERHDKGILWWDEDGYIEIAYPWIDSNASLERRVHMIRQELASSIGLWGTSDVYPDSIFKSGWTDTTEYTAIDKEIIKLQYDPRLQAGWNKIQVRRILEP